MRLGTGLIALCHVMWIMTQIQVPKRSTFPYSICLDLIWLIHHLQICRGDNFENWPKKSPLYFFLNFCRIRTFQITKVFQNVLADFTLFYHTSSRFQNVLSHFQQILEFSITFLAVFQNGLSHFQQLLECAITFLAAFRMFYHVSSSFQNVLSRFQQLLESCITNPYDFITFLAVFTILPFFNGSFECSISFASISMAVISVSVIFNQCPIL